MPPSVAAVGWLAAAQAVGCALLAIGHAGVVIPIVSALGPGGSRPVTVAALAFSAAALAYAAVSAGVFRRGRWAWAMALALNLLALAGGLRQFRGAVSAVGLVLSAAAVALLLSPTVRLALTSRPGSQPATGRRGR
jgi:hypothetical protein